MNMARVLFVLSDGTEGFVLANIIDCASTYFKFSSQFMPVFFSMKTLIQVQYLLLGEFAVFICCTNNFRKSIYLGLLMQPYSIGMKSILAGVYPFKVVSCVVKLIAVDMVNFRFISSWWAMKSRRYQSVYTDIYAFSIKRNNHVRCTPVTKPLLFNLIMFYPFPGHRAYLSKATSLVSSNIARYVLPDFHLSFIAKFHVCCLGALLC